MPLSFALLADDPRLTRTERRILRWIETHTPRNRPELWASFDAIGRALDVSVRTLQATFRRFRAWGWVAIRRDYKHLRNRRAYALGWRVDLVPLFSDAPDLTGKTSGHLSAELPVRSALPPDPPIEVPEGIREESDDRPAAETAGTTPLLSGKGPEEVRRRQAVEAAARELMGEDCSRKITRLLNREGVPLDLIAAAIEHAANKRRRGKAVTWGLVWTLATCYRDEGAPKPLPPRQPYQGCSPRVEAPASDKPVEPIDWNKLVIELGSEGHSEAAAVIAARLSEGEEKAPAGGLLAKDPPRPVCENPTTNPDGNYTAEEGNEDDGARTRNLRRDRPVL